MISVIIGTYNGEAFIEKAIQSIINQTISPDKYELIIVDDASTDNTTIIIDNYAKMYPNQIKVIKKSVNSSVAKDSPRNIGVENATGEYIMFLDQDDWYLPEALEELHRLMDIDDLDFIQYSFNYVNENGDIFKIHKPKYSGYEKYEINSENDRENLIANELFPTSTYVWSKIYRKSFLTMFNIKQNDGDQFCHFSDNYFTGLLELTCRKIGFYYKPLMCYYVRNNSWSRQYKTNDIHTLERIEVGKIFLQECVSRGYDTTKKKSVEFIAFRIMLEKTFYRFLNNWNPVPLDTLISLQGFLLRHFPDYSDNSLLYVRKSLVPILKILDKEWSIDMLKELQSQ